jgi:hypothetical protein
MKLTAEQIEYINQTLIKKGIKFDDIKIEVIDHIASEIECEIETNQQTFLEASHQVFDRWKPDFELTRGYFSLATYYPRLARNKFGHQIKVELIATFAVLSLLFISFQLIFDSVAKVTFILLLKKVFVYLYFVTVGSMVLLKFLNTKSKISSTFKHRFDERFPMIIACLIIVFSDTVPESIRSQNLFVLLIGTYFVFVLSTIYLGFKHFKFQRKLSKQ